MTEPSSWTEAYEQAREQVRRAERAGDLESALTWCHEAGRLATEAGDHDRARLEVCNGCAVLIALGRSREAIQPLRSVLERDSAGENALLALYNLACAHYALREHGKAAFYARGAIRLADELDCPEQRAWAHNQLANALLSQDHVDSALVEYQRALALAGSSVNDVARGQMLANLGYCRVLLGEGRAAFSDLFRGFRMIRRCGAMRAVMLGHLDLAFAYLEIGRPAAARQHAEKGLQLAESVGGAEDVRNAVFLLGEAYLGSEDEDSARRCFDRIQDQYPDTPYITELLLAVDLRSLVNLRA